MGVSRWGAAKLGCDSDCGRNRASVRLLSVAPRLEKDREELVPIQWRMTSTAVHTEPCHMSNGCKSYV